MVDLISDAAPEFIAANEKAYDQIVHLFGCRKAERLAYQPRGLRLQVDGWLAIFACAVC